MSLNSFELLEKLLGGLQLSPSEFDSLVHTASKEDLHLEYKHGDELLKRDARSTIREYVSGFANSVGGVLIFGVDAPNGIPIKITGCQKPNKEDLAEWTARCLTPIASYLIPPPRIQIINHAEGEILLIATQRAPKLVPITEYNTLVYYFRFHDQTLQAPDYLVSDMILGRRQQPSFNISNCQMLNFRKVIPTDDKAAQNITFTLIFHLENDNVVWAEETRFGAIASAINFEDRYSGLTVSTPNNHLLSYVEHIPADVQLSESRPNLYHLFGSQNINQPFSIDSRSILFTLPIRRDATWYTYNWLIGLYLIAKDTLPVWYQFKFAITADSVASITDSLSLDSTSDWIELNKCTDKRPLVGWSNFIATDR